MIRWIRVLILLAAFLLPPLFAASAEVLTFVSVTVNGQPKGDLLIVLRGDDELLLPVDAMAELGFARPPEERLAIGEEEYVPLRRWPGIAYEFNEQTLTLILEVDPALLPKWSVDLAHPRRANVYQPLDDSFFLNYGLDYHAGGDSLHFQTWRLSNEFGARLGEVLFLTDTFYQHTEDDSRFVRLTSSFTWDRRDSLQRLVAGDFFASSGELGSRANMGGISFAKVYRLDPYFIRYPLFDFTGLISLPSEVELYLDGMKVRSDRFAPGEFELRNFQSIGGAQTVEIVIRDALGREQRILSPFYFTDQILRRGLHEYSYNLGVLREDFGTASNRYADLAFSAFHRYGYSDSLNLGGRAEGGGGLINIGFESAWKTGSFGLLRLEAGASRFEDEAGAAGLLAYEFQTRHWRLRLGAQRFSPNYRTLADLETEGRRKLDLRAGVGYLTPRFGSFAFDYFRSHTYPDQERETLTLSWARRLWPRTYLNATLRQVRDTRTRHEAALNFSWYFGQYHSVSAAYRHSSTESSQVLEARRSAPTGEGTGWHLRAARSGRDSADLYQLDSHLQHQGRYATLRGDYSLRHSGGSAEDLRLTVAGAVVGVGDTLALTRPVRDSFALVSVGSVPEIGVLVSNQPVGRTDRRGKLIIPDLSSYFENQVAIDDRDVPIDYLMPRVRLFVSPPLRSGSCLNFPLRRYQAFTGTLLLQAEEGTIFALTHAELSLETPEGPLTFWTDGPGGFFFDNDQIETAWGSDQGCGALAAADSSLPAGVYPVTGQSGEHRFSAEIFIPESKAASTDLGTILLKAAAGGSPAIAETPRAGSDKSATLAEPAGGVASGQAGPELLP